MGRQVNLDATVQLLEALHNPPNPPRVIYASSIAVYGPNLPAVVDDHTPLAPGLSYGAHKLICEILLADAVRKGGIEGCSLRLPGIVARQGELAGLWSAFMSQLFWHARDAKPLTIPVQAKGTAWWLSVKRCAENLRAAATLESARLSVALGPRRVAQMPALYLSLDEVIEALSAHFGRDCQELMAFEPIEMIDRLFASYPPLKSDRADSLGLRHDGDAKGLVQAVFGS